MILWYHAYRFACLIKLYKEKLYSFMICRILVFMWKKTQLKISQFAYPNKISTSNHSNIESLIWHDVQTNPKYYLNCMYNSQNSKYVT